jgi:prepilin-type N-terminal cleavage/methylation domain-containing protein
MAGFRRGSSEAGFSLVEVLVSLAVISTVLASSVPFFVSVMRLVGDQGQRQVAAQLALDGVERARGLKGPALLAGRGPCGASCPVPVAGVAGYLADTERWDAPATGGAPSLPRPGDGPQTTSLGGIGYQQYWYVGRCWQPVGGGACRASSSDPVPLVRVVVAVTWPGQQCSQQVCSHVTAALFAANAAEPMFEMGTL